MIFTTFAAAALAAITGMATVRAPGGNQQQINLKPDVAYELTVANISSPKSFLHDLGCAIDNIPTSVFPPKRSLNPNYNRKANIAAKTVLTNLKNGLQDALFVPVQIRYLNVYDVQEVGPKRLKHTVDTFNHAIIVFADENDNVISFIDDDANSIAMSQTQLSGVYTMDSHMEEAGPSGFKVVCDNLAMVGLKSLSYGKVYGQNNYADYQLEINEQFSFEDMLGGNHTTGQNDPPIPEWDCPGTIDWFHRMFFRHLHNYGDEISALGDREEMVIGDDPIYSSIPLAAYSMAGALEAEDISAGHLALGASYVSNAFETALSTGYDDLKASNDTVII